MDTSEEYLRGQIADVSVDLAKARGDLESTENLLRQTMLECDSLRQENERLIKALDTIAAVSELRHHELTIAEDEAIEERHTLPDGPHDDPVWDAVDRFRDQDRGRL